MLFSLHISSLSFSPPRSRRKASKLEEEKISRSLIESNEKFNSICISCFESDTIEFHIFSLSATIARRPFSSPDFCVISKLHDACESEAECRLGE